MPIPVIAGGAILATIIVPLVVKVLLALGIGFVTYTGVGALFDAAFASIQSTLSGLPESLLSLMALANVDIFITMIFSAYTTRLTLAGLTSVGAINRINFKGVGGGA